MADAPQVNGERTPRWHDHESAVCNIPSRGCYTSGSHDASNRLIFDIATVALHKGQISLATITITIATAQITH